MNTANFLSIPASMFPDQKVLVFERIRLTYSAVLERVRRLASGLRYLGIRPGDRVAMLQTNCHQFLETYYATAILGATFVLLNYRAKPPELEYMVTAADVKALFVGDRYLDMVDQLKPRFSGVQHYVAVENPHPDMLCFEELLGAGSGEIDEAEVNESDVSIVMYTSGTTSLPKGVMLTYGDFTNYVVGTVEMADGSPHGVSLLCAPLYHIAGVASIMTALWAGEKLWSCDSLNQKSGLSPHRRKR